MTNPFFDANHVAPATGEFEPVPNGRYLLQMTEGELRENKGEGKTGVNAKFQVMDGEQQGRTFFNYYNLVHPNETTQKIGQGEFSALCHATGVLQPRNMVEFDNKPFYGDVVVTKPNGQYGPGNTIKKYYKVDGSDMKGVVGAIAPTTSATATKPATNKPAWLGQQKSA